MILLIPILALTLLQDFTTFSYCRENRRGPFELQCVQLNPDAEGEVKFKRRDADTVNIAIQLSPAAKERFLAVVKATNNLDQAESYESSRPIADLGLKRLTLELPDGKREATFNYSSRREVIELANFFEGLINQETLSFDVDTALQFERLSIPKRLDHIENELRANRISDPVRLIPVLAKIESDSRLVNFARVRATKLKKQLEDQQANSSGKE